MWETCSSWQSTATNPCESSKAQAAGTRGAGVATGLDDIRAELKDLGLEGLFPVFDSLSDAIGYLFSAQ